MGIGTVGIRITVVSTEVAAEPEADADAAAAYYGGYYGHPGYYGYGRYGYGYGKYHGYYGYPYGRYGYAHHYGKRSADAEPEADAEADPAYLYAGAYGYPYAYGAYPYGYYGFRAFAPYYARSASHQHVSTPAATYGISQLHKRSLMPNPRLMPMPLSTMVDTMAIPDTMDMDT